MNLSKWTGILRKFYETIIATNIVEGSRSRGVPWELGICRVFLCGKSMGNGFQ